MSIGLGFCPGVIILFLRTKLISHKLHKFFWKSLLELGKVSNLENNSNCTNVCDLAIHLIPHATYFPRIKYVSDLASFLRWPEPKDFQVKNILKTLIKNQNVLLWIPIFPISWSYFGIVFGYSWHVIIGKRLVPALSESFMAKLRPTKLRFVHLLTFSTMAALQFNIENKFEI